jgi:uncharacterized protein
MKLHLARPAGRNMFTGYGDDYVAINDQRYSRHIVVAPDEPVVDWGAESFETLKPADFEAVLRLKPEVVLLGTGAQLRFPRPELTRPLADAAVGFEAMDTKAACRTYNILMAEGRQVVAAILI